MVLIGDVVGDDEDEVARATSEVVRLANARGGEGFVAVSAETRRKFWLDRARTAAIAKHTNAFKINEDVVIPLERLGDYSDGIERINVELSLANKLALLDALEEYFQGSLPLHQHDEKLSAAELLGDRPARARAVLAKARERWQYLADHLDLPAGEARREIVPPLAAATGGASTVFALLQNHTLRVSWKEEVRAELEQIFDGSLYRKVVEGFDAVHRRVLRGRVFVALHMHAGDGNVHTNIPVNSDNYAMLQAANAAVARIMRLARSLGGVISGEHGIGITKLEFLEPDEIAAFRAYKNEGRPRRPLQQGKAPARRRPARRLHAVVQPDRRRVADPGGVRDRPHRRLDQGLPALREMQAGLRDARAAREPALLAAEQDPRGLAPDRGVPVRGADAPRRLAAALRRVRRRRRPLHGVPQVREPLPGGHRLRRRVDRDAQSPAQAGQEAHQRRHRCGDALPQRHRPGDDQARAEGHDRLGLQGAAARAPRRAHAWPRAAADEAAAGDGGQARR